MKVMSNESKLIRGLSNLPIYALRRELFIKVADQIESLEKENDDLLEEVKKCYKDNSNLRKAVDELKGKLIDSQQESYDKIIELLNRIENERRFQTSNNG
jgi:hypothetical protein